MKLDPFPLAYAESVGEKIVKRNTSITVAVCTYNRNGPLTKLLNALKACAEDVKQAASIGVVIVDDTAHGGARAIAEAFQGHFEHGLVYRISGHRNISIARNLALETAAPLGQWVAMTDDDCEPAVNWLSSLLDVQTRTKADAVTGPMIRRLPPASPAWLSNEPFLSLGGTTVQDGQEMTTAFTNNTMISSAWFLSHPEVRFDPQFGTIGGEDMAFFRAAHAGGLKIHFSTDGFVYENEPASRTTLRYQLRRFYWHGNSSCVTLTQQGHHPVRAFVHGVATFARALRRPVARMCRGKTPQLRYTLASILLSTGIVVGSLGARVKHK
jgi:succinoglycan biosynthesis protein ExoM